MKRVASTVRWAALALGAASCQPKDAETVNGAAAGGGGLQHSSPAVLSAFEAPLSRADLLLAVVRARSATASNTDDRGAQRALQGKRFEFRMRFGCEATGPASSPDDRSWSFDESRRILRVRVRPEIRIASGLVRSLVDDNTEAVEGFAVERPWMLSAACPQPVSPAPPTDEHDAARGRNEGAPADRYSEDMPQVGVVEFFAKNDTRLLRRNNRDYQVTTTLEPGEMPGGDGFDLLVSGRLKQRPSGSVIECRQFDPARPPACVISAEFDTVSINWAGRGEKLVQWSR